MDQPTSPMQNPIRRVTVYAASSAAIAGHYFDAAAALGKALSGAGMSVIYGGGSTGLMGAIADSMLDAGGEVHGVIPGFLEKQELSHPRLSSLTVVDDMRERKHLMLCDSDAVIALPGGCGTYEEVFEALTLKRLGQWLGPIVLLNTDHFYQKLDEFLQHAVSQQFMQDRHRQMWSMVDDALDVIPALMDAPVWGEDALSFATTTGERD